MFQKMGGSEMPRSLDHSDDREKDDVAQMESVEQSSDRTLEATMKYIEQADEGAVVCMGDITGLQDIGSFASIERRKKYKDATKKRFGDNVVIVSGAGDFDAPQAALAALREAIENPDNVGKKIVIDGPIDLYQAIQKPWKENDALLSIPHDSGEDAVSTLRAWLEKGGVVEGEELREPKVENVQERLKDSMDPIKQFIRDRLRGRPLGMGIDLKKNDPATVAFLVYAATGSLDLSSLDRVEGELRELKDGVAFLSFGAKGLRVSVKEHSMLRSSW